MAYVNISVILINYNSTSFTKDCIASIIDKTSSSVAFEIIVVDNASNFEQYLELQKFIEGPFSVPILLKRSLKNVGFGPGNNIGARLAKGRYLAFVNNDTVLQNDCLTITTEFLNGKPEAAVCSPQQYNEEGEVQKSFDYALTLSRELLGRKFLRLLRPRKYPERQKIYKVPLKVDSVPGSFMVVEANAFNKVGGFDPELFLYYEESDLCERISTLSGRHQTYLVPAGKYLHYKGQSTTKSPAIKKELKLSLLHVLKKNRGNVDYQILRYWLAFNNLMKSIVKPKNFEMFKFFWRGAPMSESLKHQQPQLSK